MLKLLAVLGVGALVVGTVRRSRWVTQVAPELRIPLLWNPLGIGSPIELAVFRKLFSAATAPVDGVTVEQREIPGGQDVFVYLPADRSGHSGALLWIHGGGMIGGLPESDHELCSRAARDLGIVVVSARYRLAPENPYPAALDDLSAALRWMLASADELGVDPARIAVGGASAGGGLAASIAQRAHDDGVPLALQLLVYPMLDDRTTRVPGRGAQGRMMWTARSNRFGWSSYLGHAAGQAEPRPYAVPARRDDLSGLPPAWIGVGDLDLFYAEDVAYAERLLSAGVEVRLHEQPGMYHGGDIFPAEGAITKAFRQSWYDALSGALAAAPQPRSQDGS
jgi:acetyl esterase/lipase